MDVSQDRYFAERSLLNNLSQLQKSVSNLPVSGLANVNNLGVNLLKNYFSDNLNMLKISDPLSHSTLKLANKNLQQETGLVPYSGNETNIQAKKAEKRFGKKAIIDFSTFNQHLSLSDNEFLYCKRVGGPIEFVKCTYSELMPVSKSKKKQRKYKSMVDVEYITISKNVNKKFKLKDCDAL